MTYTWHVIPWPSGTPSASNSSGIAQPWLARAVQASAAQAISSKG